MFSRLARPSSIIACVIRSARVRSCSGDRPATHVIWTHGMRAPQKTPAFYRQSAWKEKQFRIATALTKECSASFAVISEVLPSDRKVWRRAIPGLRFSTTPRPWIGSTSRCIDTRGDAGRRESRVAFACEIARRHFRHDRSRSQGVARRQLYRTIADGFVLVDATRCGGAWRPLRIFRDLFAAGLRNREAIERAAIQVEHIDGPILLVSGGDDHVWPAAEMSEAIVARLKQRAFRSEENTVGK